MKALSPRAYAKHREVALSTVQEAVASGRLARSAKQLPNGRTVIDAALADREWPLTSANRVPIAVMSAKSERAVASVGPRLAAQLRVIAADDLEALLHLVEPFLAGAAEALLLAGRSASETELAALLDVDGHEDAGMVPWLALSAITAEGPGDPKKAARRAGAAAVAAALAEGGADGQP